MEEESSLPEGSAVNYSVVNLKMNEYQLQMNRIFLAVIAGIVSGILRIEGVQYGLLMFVLWNLLGSGIIALHMGVSSAREYFPNGVRDIFLSQNFAGVMTYILVWTLVYDVVHIF